MEMSFYKGIHTKYLLSLMHRLSKLIDVPHKASLDKKLLV